MEEQIKKDRRKIIITGLISFVLILVIIGFTYSYFVVRDTDTSTITGTVASGELEIEVNQVAPTGNYQNEGLIPQLDTAITSAVVGRNNLNCVDDNYNTVCNVYEIIVTNKGNMSARLDGYIKLNPESSANLKWALIDSYNQGKPNLESNLNPYSEVKMVENVEFGIAGSESATKKYYLVVWISETGTAQYDTGVYTGEVVFEPTIYTSYVLKKVTENITSDNTDFLIPEIKRNQIYSIEFIDTEEAPQGIEGKDVSLVGNGSVLLYYTDSGYKDASGNILYDVKIGTETGTTIASSGYNLFSYLTNMENINLENLDTSKVTTMERMFFGSSKLTILDVSYLDTSNVTNMYCMFSGTNPENLMSLTDIIGLDKFNTSNVVSMRSMFQGCANLTSLDLSNWDTSKVTSMTAMFNMCLKLDNIDLSNFDTSKVTDMDIMFSQCKELTSLDVSNFDTSKVINMRIMFSNCIKLTELILSNFNTSKVINMAGMFSNCSSIKNIDISSFDTSNVTTMNSMFYRCNSLASINLSNFNTSNVTDINYMFGECNNLQTIFASDRFTTTNVTVSTNMFSGCTKLKGGNNTPFNSSYKDKTYARIDTASTPGYFTFKNA